uniref:Putative sulfotransferase domain contining protein n=2 Tax=viral metagenome TaxID=1070528 RepID=A0A6H1ZK16_9ZZZZ
MSWAKYQMFSQLRKFEKILVTGPQRSGTTICAKMISEDTGHKLILEEVFGNSLESFSIIVRGEINFVIQCPAMNKYIHRFDDDITAIILMRRNVDDIIASEKRIAWEGTSELKRYGLSAGIIADIKYNYWNTYQKHKITNAFEIEYEDLAVHPLWVPKEERRNFTSRQIRLGE